MAESTTRNSPRLTDWLILAFVLVVMGLLVTDIGSNVRDVVDRDTASHTTDLTERP